MPTFCWLVLAVIVGLLLFPVAVFLLICLAITVIAGLCWLYETLTTHDHPRSR